MAAFLITTFLGAFLLFQVQPLIGRYILPWFGGGPAVWTTCMLFFQVMLLAGYGYAHQLTTWNRRRQTYFHLGLLAVALAFLPIAPSAESWKPGGEGNPIEQILLLLLATVGAPYLVLAATAPLVQRWFAESFPGRSPYRLYALSNTASLLALLSYPFLVEPNLTLARQVWVWSFGFALFALCCGWCAWRTRLSGLPAPDPAGAAASAPRGGVPLASVLLWLLLSACGCALLLASTNQLCQEVAVVPFLWVAPLALYLSTYAICFNSDRVNHRGVWGLLFALALVPACWLLQVGARASLAFQVLGYLGVLFICCMACHGELARSRPDSRHLTLYYLMLATGGALGGTLVALAAPLLFTGFWELPVALMASAAALSWAWHRDGVFQGRRWLSGGAAAVIAALAVFTVSYVEEADSETVASSRNFYGVLKVIRTSDQLGEKLYLRHGRIMHGSQYADPGQRRLPTSYYGQESGAGLALRFHPRRNNGQRPPERSLRVGVIGLGVGTLAAYGERGDLFRFYEINSQVTEFADRYFTFRRDSAARIETVPGDARIALEAEYKRGEAQRFDVLLVDAFSSDSIPAHLLTRECFGIYRYHLNRDGLLLVHVTNRFLNLVPVVRAQADQMGLEAVLVESEADGKNGVASANWMILTRNREFLEQPAVKTRLAQDEEEQAAAPLWTDDFVSLWQVLKW